MFGGANARGRKCRRALNASSGRPPQPTIHKQFNQLTTGIPAGSVPPLGHHRFPTVPLITVSANSTRTFTGGTMRQPRYEVESLGPVITAIEKRAEKLKAIRSSVAPRDRTRLDLRLQALEESRLILSNACRTAPKMNAFFDGWPED